MGLFGHVSGLPRLVQQYPATEQPEGTERLKQTVKIGAVRYRGCVTVTVSSQGLYLRVQAPLSRYPAVLIPWDEVKGTRQARLYGRRGMRLSNAVSTWVAGMPRPGNSLGSTTKSARMAVNSALISGRRK